MGFLNQKLRFSKGREEAHHDVANWLVILKKLDMQFENTYENGIHEDKNKQREQEVLHFRDNAEDHGGCGRIQGENSKHL